MPAKKKVTKPPPTTAELLNELEARRKKEAEDNLRRAYDQDSMRLEKLRVKKEQEVKKKWLAEVKELRESHGRETKELKRRLDTETYAKERKSRELLQVHGQIQLGEEAQKKLQRQIEPLTIEVDNQKGTIEALVLSVQVPALEMRRRMNELLEYPQKFVDGLLDELSAELLLRRDPPEWDRLQGNMGRLFRQVVECGKSIPEVLSEHGKLRPTSRQGFVAQGVWVHPCGTEKKIGVGCPATGICPDCGKQAPR